MASWQFDFHFVPRSELERRFRTVPVTISRDDYKTIDWWHGMFPRDEFEQRLSSLLPKAQSWDNSQETWGTEDGDRFDILTDRGGISEVYGRIDVRKLSLPYLLRVVELARAHDLVLITEGSHILRPSLKEVISAIQRSPSFAFVGDPETFLKGIAGPDL